MKCNYNTIKSIIDQWDPLLLLNIAPDDEYNPEIKKIVKFINPSNYINDSELAKEIQNIFLLACFLLISIEIRWSIKATMIPTIGLIAAVPRINTTLIKEKILGRPSIIALVDFL